MFDLEKSSNQTNNFSIFNKPQIGLFKVERREKIVGMRSKKKQSEEKKYLKGMNVHKIYDQEEKGWSCRGLLQLMLCCDSCASQVPPKHSYGMLFCSCPLSDQKACSERRRQTIVPVCSYEEKQKPNCLELQASCKTNYICR